MSKNLENIELDFDFEQYNYSGGFNVDTEGFEYFTLKEVFEADDYNANILKVLGAYITIDNRSEYERRVGKGIGPHPVLILEDKFLNLPQHTTETWRAILNNDVACESIKNGHLGISIYLYKKKGYLENFYSIKLHNI